VTIHDVLPLLDLNPRDIASRPGRIYARWMIKQATRVADRVITGSEHSKMEIVRLLGTAPDKIVVIPYSLDRRISPVVQQAKIDATRSHFGIRRDYILYTGIFKERKNHAGLLRAFAELCKQGFDLDLVIAGPLEEGRVLLSKMAQELNVADRLIMPGFVEDRDMSALYAGAAVYACPSLYEGFGFTPLEAMACGVPVVCHNGTSLPEVCGEAAHYCDARNPAMFAAALRQVLEDSDLRARLRKLGAENIKRFSSERAALATIDVYNELIGVAAPSAVTF